MIPLNLQRRAAGCYTKHCFSLFFQTSLPLHVRPPCFLSVVQWEKLHMSKNERRKIFCSVLFHLIAIVCMLWSVYVLVKRTAEEIRLGKNGQYFLHTPSQIPETCRVKRLIHFGFKETPLISVITFLVYKWQRVSVCLIHKC